MAELGEFFISNESKVHVDIDMLDYTYIEKCSDIEKLKAIVQVLQSGREGHYPDLTDKAEQKLLSILPEKEKKRILRMKQQVTPTEIAEAGHDLDEWEGEIQKMDAELRSKEKNVSTKKKSTLPPIRGTKVEKLDMPSQQGKRTSTDTDDKQKKESAPRLSGYDFPAWEKFDVDAELKKLEEEETAAEREKRLAREEGRRKAEEAARKRAQRHHEELNVFREEMKAQDMTTLQRQTMAGREKQKGNESFRAGENEEAYVFYSRSLALDNTSPASAVVYANRAVVGIRLNKLESAEEDADRALQLDPTYVKALSRRGLARFKLGKTGLAIEDFQKALELKPQNAELSQLLKKAKDKFFEVEGRHYGETRVTSNEASEIFVPYKTVSSQNQLLLPREAYTIQQEGILVQVGQHEEEQQYTRIQIAESDSEDESDDEEAKGDAPGDTGFTRIAIEMSDDDDDENDSSEPNEGSASSDPKEETFTRIAISMDSDAEESSDAEEQEDSQREYDDEVKSLAEKDRGNLLMQKGDVLGALGAYNESLRLSPAGQVSTAVHSNRALAHIKLQNYPDAIADTGMVLVRDPSNLKALYRRSMAYEALKDFERALTDIKRVLALDPTNEMALKSQERLLLELQWSPKEDVKEMSFDEASATADDSANVTPTSVQADDPPSAWTVEVYRNEALSLLENGKYEKAVSTLLKALELRECTNMDQDKVVALQHLLAAAYTALDQQQKALDTLHSILTLDKNNFKAIIRCGDIYLRMNNIEKAKELGLTALRLDPTDSEARVLMDSIQQYEDRVDSKKQDTTPANSKSEGSPSKATEAGIAESLVRKNAGNDAMKANNYALAVQLYSEAIDLDPTNTLFYNNRAQAYLKMSDYINAEKDSSFVIERSTRLPNLKALFRRAMARKGLGDKKSLMTALEDLNTILAAEPANKEAKAERTKVHSILTKLLNEEKEKIAAAASVTKATEPPALDNTGMVARSTKMKSPDKSLLSAGNEKTPDKIPDSSSSASPKSPPVEEVSPAERPSPSSKSAPKPVKKVVVKNPTVPTEPPKTVYELERVWRGLKNRSELFAEYLTVFKKSTFKKVIKETVSPDLLSSMLLSVRDHLVRTNTASAFTVLEGLAATPKFEMTLSILPGEDLACVRSCVDHLSAHVDHERAQKLRQTYKL